jgi:hypothetical protein
MLMNAPAFNERKENLQRNLLIGSAVLLFLIVVLTLLGFILGHGWLFTNLPAEHKVSKFFSALEAKDYSTAFGIYNNDSDWQQHPQKYSDYPLPRFTEDWTTESPVHAPITSHHVDISKTDGSGTFGTGVIVAVRVNGEHKVFMYLNKKDGTLTWPAPHVLQYGDDNTRLP